MDFLMNDLDLELPYEYEAGAWGRFWQEVPEDAATIALILAIATPAHEYLKRIGKWGKGENRG